MRCLRMSLSCACPSTLRRGLGSLRWRAGKTHLLFGFSVGPECGVALLAGEVVERLIEGDKAGVRSLREGQQPAVADPFCGGFGGEWFGGLSKAGFRLPGFGAKFHARVFEPAVVDG